jgi:predicted DNA-binding transcriptional regulator AlpA
LYHIAETDPSFPKRIKFGPRYSGYRRESLDAWLRMKEEQAGSA